MGQNTGILKETKNMDTGQSIKNKIVHATHEAQLSKPKQIQRRALLTGIIPYPVKTILRPKVGTMDHKIQISGLTYLGSYSWVESHVPTIIVPGSPRIWSDRELPFTVQPDRGASFIDQNCHRIPSSPLLPLFYAVDIMENLKAPIDWSSVDFVTDRSNLRKLLRWIKGTGEEVKREFRIDLQLAGERTVLMTRWERINQTSRRRKLAEHHTGIGHNFEKESTVPAKGCERGISHHRIVKYDLDGFKMVVRCEVDACVVGSSEVGATADPKQSPPPSSPVVKNKTDSQLTVIPGGSEIPQESLVELTARRKIDWNEKYPQLFLSQTPNIFIASHKDGCVTSIKKRRLEMSDVGAMEQQFQPSLWKLKAALKAIQKLTILHGKNEKLTLICQAHTLRMYKTKSQQSCLPQSVLARFSRRIPTVSRRLIGK